VDAAEFDELYASSYFRLVVQLHALVGSREEAEECVQEAFVRAWAHRRRLDAAQVPEAWVRTTAYRLAVSRWRRVVRGRRPADRAVSPPLSAPPVSEAHVALVTALRSLPEEQRVALVLFHLADLSVADVARETGAAEGTVKARLSRGRNALARLLGDDLQEGPTYA
jgi:RNA polymerase sigma-70 factor (ECF subfamily)